MYLRRSTRLILVTCAVVASFGGGALAGGISIDTGLTPPEDRWILRTQLRFMPRRGDPTPMDRKMRTYAVPVVLAYGLRHDFTLILKGTALHRERLMGGDARRQTGFGDLSVLGKYQLYRLNTAEHTLGMAATLGLDAPTGADPFSSETWDLKPGLYGSWRRGPWAMDLNLSYAWNGFADKGRGGVDPGNDLSIDWALARQFSIGSTGRVSLAPVLEVSYERIFPDRQHGREVPSTGESVLYVSPGLMLTISSVILEALVRIPVWQDQRGGQLERGIGMIVGVRFMF